MKIKLKPMVTVSFDIDLKALYNFCVEKRYINEDVYLEISMHEILCEYLGIFDYVEDDDSKNIENELRCMLLDITNNIKL